MRVLYHFQEDVTPKRVVEIVEMLRRGEKPPVRKLTGLLMSSFLDFFSVIFSTILAYDKKKKNVTSVSYFSMAHKTLDAFDADQKEETQPW